MPQSIFRVDKFVVPSSVREDFLDRVRRTHAFLKAQPGFVQDFVLEQFSGPGEFNVVTSVEWASQEAFENASAVVTARYREMNFNPQETLARLGIKADLANYKRLTA
jgi:hypothetical protein